MEGLVGLTLNDKWTVIEKRSHSGTGGSFSEQFIVVDKKGNRYFMKILNILAVLDDDGDDLVAKLAEHTAKFQFERDTCLKCLGAKMTKVVVAIDHGECKVAGLGLVGDQVLYIIFVEGKGDLRHQENKYKIQDIKWVLRSMHHIATGIKQLHMKSISHQDLKPSNVIVFEEDKKQDESKVGDLGRVTDANNPSKYYDDKLHPGDPVYAPIEKYYGIKCGEFSDRLAVDLYLFGSLFFFYFLKIGLTPLILQKLNTISPNFTKSDFETDLPYIQDAFNILVKELEVEVNKICGKSTATIIETVKELCEPDPRKRGWKMQTNKVRKYDMSRYMGILNTLAKKAEMEIL